jgi:hypothetical protein
VTISHADQMLSVKESLINHHATAEMELMEILMFNALLNAILNQNVLKILNAPHNWLASINTAKIRASEATSVPKIKHALFWTLFLFVHWSVNVHRICSQIPTEIASRS